MSFCLGSRNCLQVALMWHAGKHALTFLVLKNDTYKKLSDESLAWLSARSKNEIVRMWFGWCHCYPKTSSSPASLNFRIIFLIPSCPWPGKDITKCVFSEQLCVFINCQMTAHIWSASLSHPHMSLLSAIYCLSLSNGRVLDVTGNHMTDSQWCGFNRQTAESAFLSITMHAQACLKKLQFCCTVRFYDIVCITIICLFQMTSTVLSFVMNAESLSQSVECMSCSSQCDEAPLTDGDGIDVNNTPCAVCLDRGSGFHYGVYTCEGCKVDVISLYDCSVCHALHITFIVKSCQDCNIMRTLRSIVFSCIKNNSVILLVF